MARSRTAAAVAVLLVLATAAGAQAWAMSRGHSLGGIGLAGFGALAAFAWVGLAPRR